MENPRSAPATAQVDNLRGLPPETLRLARFCSDFLLRLEPQQDIWFRFREGRAFPHCAAASRARRFADKASDPTIVRSARRRA
jgi:hypothetical protein